MIRTFDKWLLAGSGLVVAMIAINVGVTYRNTLQMHDDADRVVHTQEALNGLDDLLSTMKDAETGQRGFLITGDERHLDPYRDALVAVNARIGLIEQLTRDNARQQARISRLRPLVQAKLDGLASNIALRKGPGGFEAAKNEVASNRGKIRMDAIRAVVAEMQEDERGLLRERQSTDERAYRTAVASGAVTAVMAFASVLILIWLLRRHVDARLRGAAILHEQREWLSTTLASIGDAVVATDTAGRVTFLNAVAQTLTGWKESEAKGKPLEIIFRIVSEETRATVESPVRRALMEGTIVGLANHTILISKDGTESSIDDSAAPIRNEAGQVIGAVLVFRDITVRRREERERRQRMDQLAEAEERMRAVVNNVVDGIITIDEQGTLQTFNPAAERQFGYTQEEVSGKNIRLLMPEPYQGEHDAYLANYARTGDAKIIGKGREVLGRRKDGSTFPMDLAVSEFRLGSQRYFSGIVRDITERKNLETARKSAEDSLRQSERQLRFALDAGKMGTWAWDLVSNEVDWSAALEVIHGHTPGTFDGSFAGFESDMHPDDRESVRQSVQRSIEHGDEHRVEYRIIWPDGSLHWVEGRGQLLRDAHGAPARMVGVCGDITERKAAEEALLNADRRKDEFLATLAHELRSPLAPMRIAAELLRRAGGDAELIEQSSSIMERQVKVMVRLVDDLMDVSRIAQGKIQLRKEIVDLASVVRSAAETSGPAIEAAAHELTITLPEEPVLLHADATRLAQVFSNLLNNAAKYSERGGSIRLAAELQGREVVVSLKDNGIGIPADMLPRIFQMFTQVDRTLERSHGGLGIGLTLVKRLVELHDGTVEARSAGPGLGSEFVVRLPIYIEKRESPFPPELTSTSAQTQARRILVVDDNKDSAVTLATLLNRSGNETRIAHDGLEAIDAAEQFRPDAVLLDIGLPKLNGFEACRGIREQPWGKNILIVAVSGWAQDEDRRKAKDAGFDEHFVKPIDFGALITLLASAKPVH